MQPPLTPMRARAAERLPNPPGWAYEPKWDGFRAVAWAGEGDRDPRLDSRRKRDLLRFFPELIPALAALPAGAVFDGELVVLRDGACDFGALQRRLQFSASRAQDLATELPATFLAFDLVAYGEFDLRPQRYDARRAALDELAPSLPDAIRITPTTRDRALAGWWLTALAAAGCEGVVAKRVGGRYEDGEPRWLKVKHAHTVDCVVAGVRHTTNEKELDALLLGLYEGDALHYVGACRSFRDADRPGLLEQFQRLRAKASFTEGARTPDHERAWGHAPGPWFAVRPVVVVEVAADQIAGRQFRHGARLVRFRSDKPPTECTRDQLDVGHGLTVEAVTDVLA